MQFLEDAVKTVGLHRIYPGEGYRNYRNSILLTFSPSHCTMGLFLVVWLQVKIQNSVTN